MRAFPARLRAASEPWVCAPSGINLLAPQARSRIDQVTNTRMQLELTRADSEQSYVYWIEQFERIWERPAGRRIGQLSGRCATIRLSPMFPGGRIWIMTVPLRPAAYIRIASGHGALPPPQQRSAISEVARQRGWPEPAIYADQGPVPADGYGPALSMLSAAIGAGRHDALIMPGPGVVSRSPGHLMAFLFRCTHHGVAVEFLSPQGSHAFLMRPPPGLAPQVPPLASRPGPTAARQGPPPEVRQGPPEARQAPPLPLRCAVKTADVLVMAGVEALSRIFLDWRIWADEHGWHARRRGDVYVQAYSHGAPAFCVHGVSAVDLAAQLRWQQAADVHTPAGCARQ